MTIAATVPAVHATGLSLRYGRTHALRDVDFTLDAGVTALLGPTARERPRCCGSWPPRWRRTAAS
ncbi:hypothetical protein [Phytohabitans houttuyneae]|uniref:ABC transporter domain-containing protein n=1 Tax=Phytohabitans houttuyneae TaxID=1076126 RepID=A0A6V8KHI4_9ACTN|nr:hypothetical protein [Phytohabitans houttuyneae]GFJ83314.1 hypothetical protein Phou_074940 [Phytohabitans houttuyneae]